MHAEFRAAERDVGAGLKCTECGKRAEGNHSWVDGAGEICDACVAADEASYLSDFAPVAHLSQHCGVTLDHARCPRETTLGTNACGCECHGAPR